MTKAVALLSGGLDSTLAVKMMIDQGIEVHALNFTSAFCTCSSGSSRSSKEPRGCKSESRRVAAEFNIPIKVIVKGSDYIDIVRNPRYGYGKGLNPCVDCRIYIFVAARKYMAEIGASFIITGEVIGQRPMSQRRETMRLIEEESGLAGLILRPLCAGHLAPTIPEKTGLVDRSRLLSVSGRSRRPQIALAEELDVLDYPCPAGGCLLTDKIFSKKVGDLLEHNPVVDARDLAMLKIGRHFRFNGSKVIVGRDEGENEKLKALAGPADMLVEPVEFPGPVAVVTEDTGHGPRDFAGGLVLRYASGKCGGKRVLRATILDASVEFEVEGPIPEKSVKEAMVC